VLPLNREAVSVWDLQNPTVWILFGEVIMKETKEEGFALRVLETSDSIPDI
jgi:hypothetical protein